MYSVRAPIEPSQSISTMPLSAQIVPAISEDPTVDVTNYIRTPMWYVPGRLIPYSNFWKRVYATVPFVMRLHRIRLQSMVRLSNAVFIYLAYGALW